MEQKKDDRYNRLASFIDGLHEKNKKRVKMSGIALIVLPVVLGLIRWMTGSDKTVFLLIWVICMFLLAAYLVTIEYLDHVLYHKLRELTGSEDDPSGLLDPEKFISTQLMKKVKERRASNAAEDSEDAKAAADAEAPDTAEDAEAPDDAEDAEEGDRE